MILTLTQKPPAFLSRITVLPIVTLILGSLLVSSCSTARHAYVEPPKKGWEENPLPDMQPSNTIFLVGDAGDPDLIEKEPSFKLLEAQMKAAGKKSSVVFLGDNIYPSGLPKKDDPDRARTELVLDEQIAVAKDYPGDWYMIPGNHDWKEGKKGGRKAILRQEKYVEETLDRGNVFLPDDACGDPVRIKKEDKLVMIFLDSHWWLHDWSKDDKMNKGCEIKSRQQFLEVFEEMIRQNKNKQIVVLMHHPMISQGNHGGFYSLKQHLFPFTELNDNLYIPLPVIGSIMPLYRTVRGHQQDIPHVRYQELINEINTIVAPFRNIIFAAGHEHNLQYFYEEQHHFVVSGSGCKQDHVRPGRDAVFTYDGKGFSKLLHYPDGEVWLEYWAPIADGSTGELLYRQRIVDARPGTIGEEDFSAYSSTLPDSLTAAPGAYYKAGAFKRMLLGRQYREVWATDVTAPVLDFETELGGLTPVQKGGGMASNSLRLQTADGRQYALRSIDKNARKAFAVELQNLDLLSIGQDQISAIHPYSAFVVPTLADAAGIYHTNPKLVYLKKQPALGLYNELFPEGLYLFEERPAGDRRDVASFGNSKKIIGYIDLLSDLAASTDTKVDNEFVLRSRLFDLLIHDWDRHDDQWRWAEVKVDGKKIFRPIPRDRDQTFYRFEGVLPWYTAMFLVPKFRTFKADLKYPGIESFNARYFDRYFLRSLEREDWVRIANDLQTSITNEVIADALHVWPDQVFEIDGPEIEEKLQSRRDLLEKIALKHYDYISKIVSVPGSNESERFEVSRLENGNTKVEVFHLSKKGKKKGKVFERTFVKGETKEIRLYGMDGKDEFKLEGKAGKGIRVRIIGGEGKDEVTDESKVGGFGKKTKVYDTETGIKISSTGELRKKLSNELDVNEYDREDFKFNTTFPMVSVSSNPDDGIFLSGSITRITQGFRKNPYKAKHFISGAYAPKTGAFNARYIGDYIDAIGLFDFYLDVDLQNPEYFNWFGLGNNSSESFGLPLEFNWVRLERWSVKPMLKKSWNANRLSVKLGPTLQRYEVENIENRVTDTPAFGIFPSDLEEKRFLGLETKFEVNSVDDPINPKEGVRFNLGGLYNQEIDGEEQVVTLSSSATFYLTFGNAVEFTLANRIGGAMNIGKDYPFYFNNFIGGVDYLRGYRNERFAGKTAFYHNIDLRIDLFHWTNTIMPMDVGLTAGFDYGRVWDDVDDESTDPGLHKGYAAGIWFAPLSAIVLQPYMGFSEEGRRFNFKVGFQF